MPHLDVRYFFVTDKIKKGKVKVLFCPMHDMPGDFFTKPTGFPVCAYERKDP